MADSTTLTLDVKQLAALMRNTIQVAAPTAADRKLDAFVTENPAAEGIVERFRAVRDHNGSGSHKTKLKVLLNRTTSIDDIGKVLEPIESALKIERPAAVIAKATHVAPGSAEAVAQPVGAITRSVDLDRLRNGLKKKLAGNAVLIDSMLDALGEDGRAIKMTMLESETIVVNLSNDIARQVEKFGTTKGPGPMIAFYDAILSHGGLDDAAKGRAVAAIHVQIGNAYRELAGANGLKDIPLLDEEMASIRKVLGKHGFTVESLQAHMVPAKQHVTNTAAQFQKLEQEFRTEYDLRSGKYRDACMKSADLEVKLAEAGYDVNSKPFDAIKRTKKVHARETITNKNHLELLDEFVGNEKHADHLRTARNALASEERFANCLKAQDIIVEVNGIHSKEIETYRAGLAPKLAAAKLKLAESLAHPPVPPEPVPPAPASEPAPVPEPPKASEPVKGEGAGGNNPHDSHANCDHNPDPKAKKVAGAAEGASEETAKAKGVIKWVSDHRISSAVIAAAVIGVGAFALSAMKGREASADQSRGV